MVPKLYHTAWRRIYSILDSLPGQELQILKLQIFSVLQCVLYNNLPCLIGKKLGWDQKMWILIVVWTILSHMAFSKSFIFSDFSVSLDTGKGEFH